MVTEDRACTVTPCAYRVRAIATFVRCQIQLLRPVTTSGSVWSPSSEYESSLTW
ncbi:hypothetical protein LUR56_30475 [Streptomyces sp. MT29]|nr:hypothetical protein [Streptomyces sp. MT29]